MKHNDRNKYFYLWGFIKGYVNVLTVLPARLPDLKNEKRVVTLNIVQIKTKTVWFVL